MSVRYALLALLSEGPKHGFQLAQEFAAGTGEMWPLNTGQVYTTLQRLERDGLVESGGTEAANQTTYLITDAGIYRLDACVLTLGVAEGRTRSLPPLVERPPVAVRQPRRSRIASLR